MILQLRKEDFFSAREAAFNRSAGQHFYSIAPSFQHEDVIGFYIDEDIELLVYAANQDDVDAARKLMAYAVNKFAKSYRHYSKQKMHYVYGSCIHSYGGLIRDRHI